MIRRQPARTLTLFLLMALLAGALYAQAYARLVLTVVDSNEEPLEGVEVTATCQDIPEFHEERTTNKKGRVNFAFVDGTKVYDFKFELDGYNPTTTAIKPEIRSTSRRTFILETVGTGEAPPQGKIVYTPAEETFNDGVTFLKEGNLAEAKAKFLAALELDPDMTLAHSALASLYIEEKNYQAAIDAAKKVAAANPTNSRSYRLLYEAYNALGNEEQAKKAREKLEELGDSRDLVTMTYNEGVAALRVGDVDSAEARFLEALQADPELHQATKALAIIYGNRGQHEKAVEYSEKALVTSPEDTTLKRIRYNAYKGLGNEEKAKEAFQDLAAADPKALADQLYDAGSEAFTAGNTQAALENFQQALVAYPDHARAHYQIGLCYVNLDKKAEAKEHLQKFLELAQPNDPEIGAAKSMLEYLGG